MANRTNPVLMPSRVSSRVGFFDRFAGAAALIASRATFFACCVLLVVVWLPSYFLIQDLDTWQLIINTMTTIITFLMVALLQNTQPAATAVQHDLIELRDAVGLESHESTSRNDQAQSANRSRQAKRGGR